MKKLLVLTGIVVLVTSCSSSSGVNGLDKLPRMTSPVVTSASTSSVRTDSATIGLPFWSTTSGDFSSSSSRGMCEMFNLSRESLSRAANADKVLCYIQQTVTSDANKETMSSLGINIYDGNAHIVTLSFVGGAPNGSANTAPKMKFKIVKDGDRIKEFEMFMCMGGTTTSPSQTEYLHQVIDGENVTIASKNNEQSDSGGTWKSDFSATGKINSDAQFTEKEITAHTDWTLDANTYNYQEITLNQYADRMKISGSQVGKCGTCGGGTYENKVYSEYQLVNGTNTDVHLLALGDGAVKYDFSQGGSNSESWLGDTKASIGSNEYTSAVAAGSLPTSAAAAISGNSLTGDYAWDCSGLSEATMIVDNEAIQAACSSIMLAPDSGNTWINCYNIIEAEH